MSKKKVYSINTQLNKITGVQKVMMDVHHAVKDDYDAKIVGSMPFEQLHVDHHIDKEEYQELKNPFMFRNSIVIVHERKMLVFFWLLNFLFFQNIKVVYVHHNEFHNLKWLTILPKHIVAISDRGIKNLVDYFGANPDHIQKISNCVKDQGKVQKCVHHTNNLKLLVPARINAQKQQIEIVKHLKGNISPEIKIQFAGIGPQFEELKTMCEDNDSFEVLGYRSDVIELLRKSDYILLYSVHEGLPITMIEATMTGTPIICNDVGGNSEICINNENGWVLENWEDLINLINSLTKISTEQYERMSRNSRSIYERFFTFDVFKSKYLELLSSL